VPNEAINETPQAARQRRMLLHNAGQRRINLIWETTQATTAVLITLSVIILAAKDIKSELLSNAFLMIIALYFVRTNHVKVGGVQEREDLGLGNGQDRYDESHAGRK